MKNTPTQPFFSDSQRTYSDHPDESIGLYRITKDNQTSGKTYECISVCTTKGWIPPADWSSVVEARNLGVDDIVALKGSIKTFRITSSREELIDSLEPDDTIEPINPYETNPAAQPPYWEYDIVNADYYIPSDISSEELAEYLSFGLRCIQGDTTFEASYSTKQIVCDIWGAPESVLDHVDIKIEQRDRREIDLNLSEKYEQRQQ